MNKVLILDFGSQYTQLIARRVRELNIYAEIKPYNIEISWVQKYQPSAIILSGGPASTGDIGSPRPDLSIFELNLPILGICYGQQVLSTIKGGQVQNGDKREFGRAEISVDSCPLFNNLPNNFNVWMSHADKVTQLPNGFKVVAQTAHAPMAAIANDTDKIYGLQFHPEVTHGEHGTQIIKNFLVDIAGLKQDWSMANFRQQAIADIRAQVGSGRVLCAVSGGVDSSVVAKLLHEAIGDQLVCVFVDHGMLRLNEGAQVKQMFEQHFNMPIIYKDASELFLGKLKGVSDPEQKRKIIGNTFIEVFEAETKRLEADGKFEFLAQGTLYPDVIESVSFIGGPSVTIKSHHNVGGLPERMQLKLVEPVRELFKDEVRKLGLELGMAKEMIARHPFPGPGLAIRVLGEIEPDKVNLLQQADAIYIEEIKKAGLYDDIWQAFAVLLPCRSVGVMGDNRTYDYVCALRAVTSSDGMTADFYDFNHKFLSKVSNRIVNEVNGINRVTYDITSKPPGTIEWE